MLGKSLFGLAALVGTVFAQIIPFPDQDPFYKPPAGWESATLGTVYKSRTITPAFVGNSSTTYQILYRSQSHNGTALYTVSTIFVPPKPAKDRFIVNANAEDSLTTKCAPSYTFRQGAQKTNFIPIYEAGTLTSFLNAGWIVSSPDHEGPDSAFAAGRLEGRLTLDAARATLNFAPLGLDKNAKVAFHGYSGGAFAVGWAAAQLAAYAPELNVVGIAHGGTPANVSATLQYLDGGLFAGFAFAGALGLAQAYAPLSERANTITTAKAREAIARFQDQCAIEIVLALLGQKLQSTDYTSLGANLLADPAVSDVVKTLNLGENAAEVPKVPLLVYHAALDEIIPVDPVTTMVDRYCKAGANLQYTTVAIGEHLTVDGRGGIQQFFADRFNGVAWPTGCRRSIAKRAVDIGTDSVYDSDSPEAHHRTISEIRALHKKVLKLPKGQILSLVQKKIELRFKSA